MMSSLTGSPVDAISTVQIASPTSFVTARSIVRRADAAMTTPYVFPPECTFEYEMTTQSGNYIDGWGEKEETYLYIDKTSNTHWQACQPTGATEGYIAHRPASVFRGAVCPQGWMAFDVGLATQAAYSSVSLHSWSTAQCCKTGDTLGENVWSINYGTLIGVTHNTQVCISTTNNIWAYHSQNTYPSYTVAYWTTFYEPSTYTQIVDYGSSTKTGTYRPVTIVTTLAPFVRGRAFYPPMSMEWVEEDNKTLDPKWPTLTNDMLIPSWTPSQDLGKTGFYDNKGKGRDAVVKPPPSMPNKVAIPVVAVLGALLFLALGAILTLLFSRRVGKMQAARNQKPRDSQLGIALGDEAGSTAHLAGQGENVNPAMKNKRGILGRLQRPKSRNKDVELRDTSGLS